MNKNCIFMAYVYLKFKKSVKNTFVKECNLKGRRFTGNLSAYHITFVTSLMKRSSWMWNHGNNNFTTNSCIKTGNNISFNDFFFNKMYVNIAYNYLK